jgi:hypothetical protein
MKNKKETTVHKEFLLGKGYSIPIYTHVEKHEGHPRIAIHRYILIPNNDQVKIIIYK